MICVHEFTKRIEIKSLTGVTDAHGFIDNTAPENWTQHTTSFAKVKSKGGKEFWKVDQVNADVSHVWWCPYSREMASVTTDMQLICEGVTYEIESVVDVDLNHELIEIQTKRAV